ncbi:MAG: flagellar type III secretion system protein FliR [Clostridiales bacterium]|nr:flagellar type III secretion system protein FliR [Clostridiales bacterium]
MEDLIQRYSASFPIFILIFFRVMGLFIISPIFSRQNIPTYWKILFSVFLSYILFSLQAYNTPLYIHNVVGLMFLIIKELFLGFIFGYITTVVFSAILLSGQLIDSQIGFGMVNILDPHNNIQVPLLGNFNNIIALLLFLIIDGHHQIVNLLVISFDMIPIGQVELTADIFHVLVIIFKKAFELAVTLSLPIIGAALITEGVLGLMTRSIPQINIFAIGIPLKIFIGLFTLFIFIPALISTLGHSFMDMLDDMKNIIEMMMSN